MISRTFRELTSEERQELASRAHIFRFNLVDTLGIMFLTAVLFVGGPWCLGRFVNWLVFQRMLGTDGYAYLPTYGAVVGIPIFLLAFVGNAFNQRAICRSMQEEFDRVHRDGRVEVVSCNVHGSVELGEFEDEGPGFFLDVGDNAILFVQGQELLDWDPFPASHVTVTRVVATKEQIDFQSDGNFVVPRYCVDPEILKHRQLIRSGSFFRSSLEEVKSRLRELKESDFDCLDEVATTVS